MNKQTEMSFDLFERTNTTANEKLSTAQEEQYFSSKDMHLGPCIFSLGHKTYHYT